MRHRGHKKVVVAVAHNLLRSFQLQTLATAKPRSRKRTYAFAFRGMRTLREDGARKVLAGLTSPDEVIRATVGDVD